MRRFSQKINFKKGQSIFEYALLIFLALAGVYILTPFVVRSWNGNIKGWQDSMTDSYQEPIGAAPPRATHIDCQCSYQCNNPPPGGDGLCCGHGTCEEYQNAMVWTCNHAGCQDPPGGEVNRYDCSDENPGCCTTPVKLKVPDYCGETPCLPEEVPAGYFCGGDPHTPPNPWERYVCEPDPSCVYQCDPQSPAPCVFPLPCATPKVGYHNDICRNDNLNLPGPDDTLMTFVERGKCSSPSEYPKCEWECELPYHPDRMHTECKCPPGSWDPPDPPPPAPPVVECVMDCGAGALDGSCDPRTPGLGEPTRCEDLTSFQACQAYRGVCSWDSSASPATCETVLTCSDLRTNVTLTQPDPAIYAQFTRCDSIPWCGWTGPGGGYCCPAVLSVDCPTGEAQKGSCPAGEVVRCCEEL
ncbi:MAG: hypothetical protein KBD53_00705 [Candidatus Omnitrophica bacterium]|nr:hypothetical protein [Candidatus Omnitrophota bacterium]